MTASTTRTGRAGRFAALGALTATAALLAGCASGPGAPSQPTSPPVAIAGADPVPLGDALLRSAGLDERVSADGIAVLWLEPGHSLAVVLGGSGAGGACIPQPGPAALDEPGASVVIRFEPPDPETMCTMDYVLHGWELALPSSADPERMRTVRLANAAGDDAVEERTIGPADVLVASADPAPSESPSEPVIVEPTAIDPAALPPVEEAVDPMQDPPIAVHWIEPGRSLAVLLGASGTESCVPVPVVADVTGPGTVEVRFEPARAGECTADLRLYGWRFVLAEPMSATMPVEVSVAGVRAAGDAVTIPLPPDDVIQVP